MPYNAAGTNVSAGMFRPHRYDPLPFVVDHTLYRAAFSNETEAHERWWECNAENYKPCYKTFPIQRAMGEWYVHKKVLELRIPTFDGHNNNAHVEIARL